MKTESIKYNAAKGLRKVTLTRNGAAFDASAASGVSLRARNISGGPPKVLPGVAVASTTNQFEFDFAGFLFSEADCGTWVVDVVALYVDGAISFPSDEFSFLRILEGV